MDLGELDLTTPMVGRRARDLIGPVLAFALILAGCSQGTVSNDDSVSRRAAERAVERFFLAVHEGRYAAACRQLPLQQRDGLARLSASRHGARTCEGALGTLSEFALARRRGKLAIGHDLGFRGALPHRAKEAVDDVAIGGRKLGGIGLRRTGDTWTVAVVCNCP